MFDLASYLLYSIFIFVIVTFLFYSIQKKRISQIADYRKKAILFLLLSHFITLILILILSIIFGGGTYFAEYLFDSTHSLYFYFFPIPNSISNNTNKGLVFIITLFAFCANSVMNYYLCYEVFFSSWVPRKKMCKIISAIFFSLLNNPYISCFTIIDIERLFWYLTI